MSDHAALRRGRTRTVNPRTLAALETDRRSLRDLFSTKTPTVQPKELRRGNSRVVQSTDAPPRAILPVQPDALPRHAPSRNRHDDRARRSRRNEFRRRCVRHPLERLCAAGSRRTRRAQKSSYRTESFACRPVASTYQFTVTFGT